MIYIDPIACANVERVSYIFYQNFDSTINKCVGRFIEQENDAGEVQYLFDIYQDRISEQDAKEIVIPGIDVTFR